MKIFGLVLLLLFMIAIPVFANSLAGDPSDNVSVWGFDIKSSTIYGSQGYLLGGFSGKYLNDSLLVGTEGYLLLNAISAPPTFPASYNIGLFYCGLKAEYSIRPSSIIHLNGDLLAGAGYVKYLDASYNLANGPGGVCLVVEPGVNVMMNITDSFQAGVGMSYRWVSGLNITGLTNDDLKGYSVNFIFRFVEF